MWQENRWLNYKRILGGEKYSWDARRKKWCSAKADLQSRVTCKAFTADHPMWRSRDWCCQRVQQWSSWLCEKALPPSTLPGAPDKMAKGAADRKVVARSRDPCRSGDLPSQNHCDSQPQAGHVGETGRGAACGSGQGCSIHRRHPTGSPPQSYSVWGSLSASGTCALSFWGLDDPPASGQPQECEVSQRVQLLRVWCCVRLWSPCAMIAIIIPSVDRGCHNFYHNAWHDSFGRDGVWYLLLANVGQTHNKKGEIIHMTTRCHFWSSEG